MRAPREAIAAAPAPHGESYDTPTLVRLGVNTSLFVLVGVLVVAAAIHVRATVSAPAPPFFQVWLWQAVTWLPWFLLVPTLTLAVRAGQLAGHRLGLAQHVAASLLVAGLSTAWFSAVSSLISPFLDAPETRFGVFRWFFVFWAFGSFLGYWAIVGFVAMAWPPAAPAPGAEVRGPLPPSLPRAAPAGAAVPPALRLVLESGGATHVVAARDVDWVEAQDYYAVVHAGERAIWVKRSLDDLSAELEAAGFLRVHRSTLVNLDRLERIEKDERGLPVVVLRGGLRRRVSHSRWQQLRRDWRQP
jgi:hypothetical protein